MPFDENEIASLETMTRAIADLTMGKTPDLLPPATHASEPINSLRKTLNGLIASHAEAGEFVLALARGQLNITPPPRNYLISPFKQLHANLKHLVWQTQEVAKGDYSQRVDFLGEFSEAFNLMIAGLRERKRLQEELRQARDDLELRVRQRTEELNQSLVDLKNAQAILVHSEKMASLGQLAAGVAHEINNPIGYVSSNMTTLEAYQSQIEALLAQYRTFVSALGKGTVREGADAQLAANIEDVHREEARKDIDFILEDTRDLITECRQGIDRVAKIVADLKHFALPGEDQRNFTDLNACMESTLNVIWNQIKYRAEVKKVYGELPQVLCYSRQVGQVFMNLLVNAAQAMEKRGCIEIATRHLSGQVEIKISDDGAGIAEEHLSKVFDAFFSTKPVGMGTGLGLNVAYNIVHNHSGTIEVASQVGQGSVFTIRLPVPYTDKE